MKIITCLLLLMFVCVQTVPLEAQNTQLDECVKKAKDKRSKCLKSARDEYDDCLDGDESWDTVCWLSYSIARGVCYAVAGWEIQTCVDLYTPPLGG